MYKIYTAALLALLMNAPVAFAQNQMVQRHESVASNRRASTVPIVARQEQQVEHSQMQMGDMARQRTQEKNAPSLAQAGRQYMQPPAMPALPETISLVEPCQRFDGQQLGLTDLIAIAEANNPTLRQANLHIEATTGEAIQAGLYPNPTFRYSAEQIGVEGTAGEFHGGIISQEIVRGGKLQLSRAKFLERVKVAEANAIAQQFRVCNDVRIHFYSSLSWQQRVAIQRELAKAAEDNSITAREAFNMGQANAAEIRRTNVALQKARLKLLQAENMQRQTIRHLSALIGTDIEGSLLIGQLESSPVSSDFQTVLSELWLNSPELIAARAKLRSDRLTVQRERIEPISNFTFEGGAGYNFETNETVAVAGVSLPLKIYDRNQGTIRQAQADLARQCAEITRIEERLRRDLSMEYEHYLTASQYVQQYQDVILPELKETYRLLLVSYKENRTNWNEVLHSQTDYFMSRIEYFDWLEKFRKSEVLIDGMLLHDGLMAAAGTTPPGHIDAVAKPR